VSDTAPRPDYWLCRPVGRAAPWWRVVVEFRPPACATLIRSTTHPRGDALLAAAVCRIDASAPTRLLIRATRARTLAAGIAAAIRAALPQDDAADGRERSTAPPSRTPAADARRAEALYLAGLCRAYGWTPDQARALTPREMMTLHAAAQHLDEQHFARQAALHGVRLPAPPPLRLDARDAARAAAADARRRPTAGRRRVLNPEELSALLDAVGGTPH